MDAVSDVPPDAEIDAPAAVEAPASGFGRSPAARRTLEGFAVVGSIALLWLAGYLMGRDAGRESGSREGFVAARVEASEAARVAGLRGAMERFAHQGTYEERYAVHRMIDERLANRNSSEIPGEKEIAAEMQAIADEALRAIFPDGAAEEPGADFALHTVPAERHLILRAAGPHHGELTLYLYSKEDYLVWKQAERAERR